MGFLLTFAALPAISMPALSLIVLQRKDQESVCSQIRLTSSPKIDEQTRDRLAQVSDFLLGRSHDRRSTHSEGSVSRIIGNDDICDLKEIFKRG